MGIETLVIGVVAVIVVVVIGMLFFRGGGKSASFNEVMLFGLRNGATLLTLVRGKPPMLVIDGKSAPVNMPPVDDRLLGEARSTIGAQKSLRVAFGGRYQGDGLVRSATDDRIELELKRQG